MDEEIVKAALMGLAKHYESQRPDSETVLIVDGVRQTSLAGFTLRWVDELDKPPEAVLYHDGRRVVSDWQLVMEVNRGLDKFGRSA